MIPFAKSGGMLTMIESLRCIRCVRIAYSGAQAYGRRARRTWCASAQRRVIERDDLAEGGNLVL